MIIITSVMSGPWRTTSQDLPLLEDLVRHNEGQFHSLFTPFVTFGSSRVEGTGSQAPQRTASDWSPGQGYRTGARYGGHQGEGVENKTKPVIKTYERKKRVKVGNINDVKREPITRVDIDMKVEVKDELQRTESYNVESPNENTEICKICDKNFSCKDNFKKHLKECMHANLPVLKSNEEILKMCRGSLACNDDDFDIKIENVSDESDGLENSESEDEDEQVDARKLYPRRQIGNGNDHLDLEEGSSIEEEHVQFSQKVINSIEIMEKSCFGNLSVEITETKASVSSYQSICKNCQKRFSTKRDFARHMYAHTFVKKPQDEEPVICSNCGREYRNKSSWETHSNRTGCCGIPKTIFPCEVCKKTFTRKDNLREHLKGHAGFKTRKRKSHTCMECGKVFGGEGMLNIHRKLHEKQLEVNIILKRGRKDFKCKDCGKCFSREQRLVLHSLYVHHGLKPYPCSSCEKRYCRKEDLNRHALVAHSNYPGSKEHVQKICQQTSLDIYDKH